MSDSRSHLHQQLSLLQQDIKNSNMLETIKSEPDYYTLHYIIDRLGVLTEDLANDHDQFTHHLCEFIATLKDIPDQSAGLLDLTTQLSSSEHAKPGLIQAYQQRAHKIYQSLQEKQSELKNYLQTLSAQPNDPLSKQCGELCTTACEEIDRYCRLGPVYLLPLQQQLQDALEKAFTQMMQENFPDYNFHPLSMLRKKDERFECDILFSTQFFASREKAEEAINNMKKQFEEIHGRNISSDSLFLITSNNNQAPFRVGINLEQYSAELGKPFLLKNLIPMAQKDFAWNFLLSKPVIHGKLGIHAVTGQSLKKGLLPIEGLFSLKDGLDQSQVIAIDLSKMEQAIMLPVELGKEDYLSSPQLESVLEKIIEKAANGSKKNANRIRAQIGLNAETLHISLLNSTVKVVVNTLSGVKKLLNDELSIAEVSVVAQQEPIIDLCTRPSSRGLSAGSRDLGRGLLDPADKPRDDGLLRQQVFLSCAEITAPSTDKLTPSLSAAITEFSTIALKNSSTTKTPAQHGEKKSLLRVPSEKKTSDAEKVLQDLTGELARQVMAMRKDYVKLPKPTVGHRIKIWATHLHFFPEKLPTYFLLRKAEEILQSKKEPAEKIVGVIQLFIARAQKFKKDHAADFDSRLQDKVKDHHGTRMAIGILQNLFTLAQKNEALTIFADVINTSKVLAGVSDCELGKYAHLNGAIGVSIEKMTPGSLTLKKAGKRASI